MATEIERKFLVDPARLPDLQHGRKIMQGYIPTRNQATVRVRVLGHSGYLTIKGPTVGIARSEFEYPIPVDEAQLLLNELCEGQAIEKTRYRIPHEQHVWEIDVFEKANAGLILAEVELRHVDDKVELPEWVANEVTGDPRYYNQQLMHCPYQSWGG